MMFYLGGNHSASSILKEQSQNLIEKDKVDMQLKMCDITRLLKVELQKNNIDALGDFLHDSWMLKRSLASGISTLFIDEAYERARKTGAAGGKLLGAGGAGFMLFYVPEEKQKQVREEMAGFREMEFEMDNSGASIIHVDKD